MFKTTCIIIALLASISFYNDHSSLNQWGKVCGDVVHITTKFIKASGHEANIATRADDTIVDKVSNVAEDVVYKVKN
jgi:hypothetical protein